MFGIFVANEVSGGSIEAASFCISLYMVCRVVGELIVGMRLNGASDRRKAQLSVVGIMFIALFHILFAFSNSVLMLYVLNSLIGLGFGVVSPAKYALFAEHLDKGKESSEWSIYDATTFGGMALSAAVGGVIAGQYGFGVLFVICGTLIFFSAIPYMLLSSLLTHDYGADN